ncbi:MAG: response regulator transcription factor [Blastocatellia bacterium]|nr:response regulator transcription factor [Blastocatellia bacterium]
MNTAVPTTKAFHQWNQPFAPTTTRPRVIIITDSVMGASHLHAALSQDQIAVTVVHLFAEDHRACWCDHDLAIVDVAPDSLRAVLSQLRASQNCEAISILVDITRLTNAPDLAGVLSAYRAMPCGGYELLRLARRRLAALANPELLLSPRTFTTSTL